MIRKLAFALSLLGASFTGFVHALGLGEADVKSTLNQPLRAEIQLVNVDGLTNEEILPGLATREEFLKAGVDRIFFLSDISFTVDTSSAGEPVVVLSTKKPVREPFLNFLVEVIWPSGRLLREYALLIDPPTFTEEKAQPVQAPAAAAPQSRGDTVSLPSRTTAPKAQVSRIQVGGEYGPTNSRDTLWNIALKARPDRSVSPQQVMLAIQDLNPNAFIDDNINKLKEGQVLRLPTLDQIRQRSSYEAINEVIAQNEALRPTKRKAVVSVSKVNVPQQKASVQSSGDELKLVVADKAVAPVDSANSGDSEMGGASKVSSEEMALTLEKLDKANSDNAELSGRLEDLEGQLETLQRLLTLKNDQLASLQQQMQANELAKAQAEAQEGQEEVSEPAGDEGAGTDGTEPAGEEVVSEEQASTDQMAAVEESPAEAAAEETMAQEEVKAPAEPAKPEVVKKPVGQEPDASEMKQKSFMETVFSNPLYMGLGALAILVLVALIWFVSRSNAQREQEYQENYLEDDGDVELAPEDDMPEEEEDYSEGEERLAEQDDEEEVIPQDEEEDAIAEADVYIAYGRLDQAAGILEDAISSDPVRTDYRLKLLEVYKESNDVNAFNRQYSELEAIQDAEAMEKANLIKAELDESDSVSLGEMEEDLLSGDNDFTPSEDAFETDSLADEAEEFASEVAEDDLDIADDLDVSPEALADAEELEGNNDFDFDSVEEVAAPEIDTDEEELDIDLSSEELDVDLDIDLDVDQAATEEALDVTSDAAMDLELPEEDALDAADDLADEELDVALEDVELTDELDQESEIDLPADLDLSGELDAKDLELAESEELATEGDAPTAEDLELGEEELEPAAEDLSEPEAAEEESTEQVDAEADDHVVSDDILDEAVEALGDPDDFESDLGEGDDFDFLEGTDEASTKLDLARAYIDMGDIEGARDILEEVKTEGNDEQQSEAQSLLDSIND